jgi:DNA polymerase-3 subunit delta
MPEVRCEALQDVLAEASSTGAAPVYLLYGDEFLYKSAFKTLLDHIVPQRQQNLNYEALDGDSADIDEMIARLNTFPLLPGPKVIALHDTNMFYSKVTADELLYRSKAAFEKQDLRKSARHFVRMLSIVDLSLDDLGRGDWQRSLDLALGHGSRAYKEVMGSWVGEIIDYCLVEQRGVPEYREDADVLAEAVSRGFPESNHLIVTTDFIDKRRKLYKTMKEIGVVLDCSVPQGDRAADKRQQKEIILAYMKEALGQAGKTMAQGGFEALYEKTGSSLRNFSNELGKLIAFVGDRKEILAEDVEHASDKTKQDPIYELTNTIGERDTEKALLLVDNLLKANIFPLQILSALVNQVRKMLLARDLIRSVRGSSWKKGMSYGAFQKTMVRELDKGEGDLAPGKVHPFVVYKTFVHSDNYTLDELAKALEVLLDADIRLKTSGQDPKLVLERAILAICGSWPKEPHGRSLFQRVGRH